jgi:hypothetical protein
MGSKTLAETWPRIAEWIVSLSKKTYRAPYQPKFRD